MSRSYFRCVDIKGSVPVERVRLQEEINNAVDTFARVLRLSPAQDA